MTEIKLKQETKTKPEDILKNIIDDLYKNSNNKRNEKNALKGKTTLMKKIQDKNHALVTLGLYRKLTKKEQDCVRGTIEDEAIKYGILKKIGDMIAKIEAGEKIDGVYCSYTPTGKDILTEYLAGNNSRNKSDSKQKKVLSFSKIFLNQERQKSGDS